MTLTVPEVMMFLALVGLAYWVRTWWILMINGVSVTALAISLFSVSENFAWAYLAVGLTMFFYGVNARR
ncbi:MAG: hypothetical protein PHV74_06715 [Dehalococcoidia bacterium]|nr:hypothetical protein [Dehalococcoidia bacterium]